VLRRATEALFLIASALTCYAAKPADFAGRWELNVKESSFGSLTKPARMTIDCTVNGDEMHSVTTTYLQQDNQAIESTWYLDGKRHPTDKPVPGYSITRWQDGLLISEVGSNDGAYKQIIRLTLSSDGKTVTEEVQTKTPNGNNREKLIWQKK